MDQVRIVAACVILALWLGLIVVGAFNPDYDLPTGTGVIVGVAATWLFAGPYMRRNGKD